jgi:hypothetical protein
MTAIAATTASTPIAIQAFRLTVIGFLLSFGRVVHRYYEVLPIRDWPDSGVRGAERDRAWRASPAPSRAQYCDHL